MVCYEAADRTAFQYCGTWQAWDPDLPHVMIGSWNTSYVELLFTGTEITLFFPKASSFTLTLDGVREPRERYSVVGSLTLSAPRDGEHRLRIHNEDRTRKVWFGGAAVPDGCRIVRPAPKPHYIEFVGDSISDSSFSFSHRVGDLLGWDFSVRARSAMALQCDRGYWRGTVSEGFSVFPYIMGMEEAFFKTECPDDFCGWDDIPARYRDWCEGRFDIDFDAMDDKPDIVFIFLGTNDDLFARNVDKGYSESFVRQYRLFVEKIFRVYGADTQICILQALTNSNEGDDTTRFEAIRRAATELMAAYPDRVRFLDSDVIAGWQVEISPDGTHPSQKGYDRLTEALAALLPTLYE